jgi:hypothetical protein
VGIFALGLNTRSTTVQRLMTAIRASIVGPLRDTSNSASIATCAGVGFLFRRLVM